jgi:ADP-heptose:LPS heptosyltransferase
MFLSNDSGPSKVAMALRVPTVTIWGPSDRPGAGPWDKNAGHVSVSNGIACSPCFVSGLTLRGPGVLNHSNCGHRGCLKNLSVDDAYSHVQ